MFWRAITDDGQSVNELLDKKDVKLTEILDDHYTLQEVKSENDKLLEYLKRPDILLELIHLCLSEPSNTTCDSAHKKYRYCNLSTEIFCAGSQHFVSKLAESSACLDFLSKFLIPDRLNPLLASFFSRIFSLLVQHKTDKVLELLKRDKTILSNFLKHIETWSIAESLVRLCTFIENREKAKTLGKFLNDSGFLESLVSSVRGSSELSNDSSDSATYVLTELIRIYRFSVSDNDEKPENELIDKINSLEFLHGFINLHELQSREQCLLNMLSLLYTLLSTLPGSFCQTEADLSKLIINNIATDSKLHSRPSYHPDRLTNAKNALSIYFCDKMIEIVDLIRITDYNSCKKDEKPNLTKRRVMMAKIFTQLVYLKMAPVHDSLVKNRAIHSLLECCFACPESNLLHSHTLFVVYFALNGSIFNEDEKKFCASPLIEQIFEEGFILKLVLKESENAKKLKRSPLKGHLMRIAQILSTVIKNGPNSDLIKRHLRILSADVIMSWVDFEQTELHQFLSQNEPDMVGVESGGKIDMMQDDSMTSSNSIHEAILRSQGDETATMKDDDGFPMGDNSEEAASKISQDEFERFCDTKMSDLSFEEPKNEKSLNDSNNWVNDDDFKFIENRKRANSSSSSSSNDSREEDGPHSKIGPPIPDDEMWAEFEFPATSCKKVSENNSNLTNNACMKNVNVADLAEFDPFFVQNSAKNIDADWAKFNTIEKEEKNGENMDDWPGNKIISPTKTDLKACSLIGDLNSTKNDSDWANFGVQ